MSLNTDLTIALDVMGGDQGPLITISSAITAISHQPNLHLILCGDEIIITETLAHFEITKENLATHKQLSIFPTSQVVLMSDKPIVALRTKKDSSMRKALDLVHEGRAQACVSAGNTGALFSMAHFVLKNIPGVERPALISSLPTHDKDKHVFMLDLGANVFCDSHVLYQFGVMGSVMAEQVDGINKPRVALLNMGEEAIKGSDHIKLAALELTENKDINYVGFIEGSDIFSNKADVIVCDGFVGNVALKTCEGVARLVYEKSKTAFSASLVAKLFGSLLKPSFKKLFKTMNPDQYNGASLIGLRGIVVKSHGNANSSAFLSAIEEAVKEVERQVPEKIKTSLEHGFTCR
ncbi:phosphate acyltransferase PlsX [Colwellia psychrerythraea]|uniref:Phosphate acyltransferase n=1 Tax=Colwellia psychrerythraea (strain 34H / ATCC BAA-681) TaxID=167879 RepID=PLSX_COLP3|nr:phosphate acyltransferase PlsX [Colwellia psychrerythraea]Q482K2.1 RecName: Full=Phosphate acyltransferase; AltName: Full=Acyl-ACP phosphotransacylase; AltName: Full=Acyl-[acyl-carrier-protein]--phosphate acyltransferase; AltName: Full=Phosphate-acyl-ACP acyltransferase [Colwellia psychrerythraea 34H]AAZ27525.1 fatty acid/phospholipid synthesis protein PlsX [Colwellia psychrerythraea 34H]